MPTSIADNATAHKTSALRKMESRIDQLPLLPQVLARVLQLNPDAADYFDQFEVLVKEDPTFAVRVIALANSAASSPAVPVSTIKDALTRMGAGTIRALVSSLPVQRVFMPTEPGQIRLWKHSITAAVSAQHIARLAPALGVDIGQAYLVGLLHDIGRFVMFEHAAPDLLKVDESNWQSPEDLIQADMGVYKFTHCELGYLACRHWGLPGVITDVVRAHHEDLPSEIDPGSTDAVRFCVQIADRLCMAVLENTGRSEMTNEDRQQRIVADCLKTTEERKFLSAGLLGDNIGRIDEESGKLLAGLGFA